MAQNPPSEYRIDAHPQYRSLGMDLIEMKIHSQPQMAPPEGSIDWMACAHVAIEWTEPLVTD